VVKEAYLDTFAFDPNSDYYDPKSSPGNPRWVMVDLQFESAFAPPITLDELKQTSGLEEMMVLRKGCRLSVQPVTAQEWQLVCNIRG
jgi:predicted RNA-binding protein with PUA-like domain